jgi:uncharacterized protein YndB with AHSA1/START domain
MSQESRTNPAECPHSLVVERVFAHPPEKLWRALTERPLLAQWMMNNDFEPVVGHKFQFRAEPMPNWNGIVDCEVLVIDLITGALAILPAGCNGWCSGR